MRIVHFGHACVLLETAGERILLDPGTLSNGFEGERELSAVLITHQHFDHLDAERIPNVGYIVDHGAFYHPGDSFFVPEQKIDVLGLPTGAPWLKAGEAVDYLRAVAPRIAVPIHEGVLSRPGLHYGLFTNLAPEGTE